MDKIILTSNNQFTKDGVLLQVETQGIDLTDFFENPIMLFNHEYNKPIGNWEQIEITETDIIALPNFDADLLSKTIGDKYSKGSLKAASVGLEILDAYYDEINDAVVIYKSKLLEASIVSIPANPKAKKIKVKYNDLITFGIDGKLDMAKYKEKLKMDKLKLTIEDGGPIEDEKKSMDEPIETTEDDVETLEEVSEKVEATEVSKETVITDTIANLQSVIDALKMLIEEKETVITEQSKEISELKLTIETENVIKKDNIINDAIKLGKINSTAYEKFVNLSIDQLNDILDNIPTKNVSLSSELSRGVMENHKTYDWYLKNDKDGLKQLAKTNPSLYKQLENQTIKNKNK